MTDKKPSKAAKIGEFMASNPKATWKDAEPTMRALGISQGYFNTCRSKLNPKRRKKSTAPAATKAPAVKSDLSSVAKFVRSVGGLDAAKKLLTELEEVQV